MDSAEGKVEAKVEEQVVAEYTSDPIAPEFTFYITESLLVKNIKEITPADTTDYAMEDTLAVHKLKSGETIIQLSNKYYGDKRLWPYIVKYNHGIYIVVIFPFYPDIIQFFEFTFQKLHIFKIHRFLGHLRIR